MALTEDVAHTILAFIRAGAFDYVAAEAAGISARTFRDWIARGEGSHPTRRPTPKLRTFAHDVRRAKAEARVGAEVTVYREKPAYWLARAARSQPEREGWTTPAQGSGDDDGVTSMEERLAAIDRRHEEDARRAAAEAVSGCTDADCGCTYHQRRYFDELDQSRRRQSD